jgi:AcrR family transcriptional regulator
MRDDRDGSAEAPRSPAKRMSVHTSVKNPILVRERRAALTAAAVKVFAEKGFHSARIRDVVEAAGMSQGAAYNYVGSKEELLYLVCHDYLSGYRRILSESLADVTVPWERLQRLLRATVRATLEYRHHHLVLIRELHCLDRQARAPFLRDAAEYRKTCQQILEELVEAGEIVIDDARLTANILVHLPELLIMRRWDLGDKADENEAEDVLVAFMLRGLGFQPKQKPARKAAPRKRRVLAKPRK